MNDLPRVALLQSQWAPTYLTQFSRYRSSLISSGTAQILRHRSFSFQEFSQRYAKALGFEEVEARRQDKKNRQNSFRS